MEGTTKETGGMLYIKPLLTFSLHHEKHSCISPTPWGTGAIDTCGARRTQNRFLLEGRNFSLAVKGRVLAWWPDRPTLTLRPLSMTGLGVFLIPPGWDAL